jgi:hypothetical protein
MFRANVNTIICWVPILHVLMHLYNANETPNCTNCPQWRFEIMTQIIFYAETQKEISCKIYIQNLAPWNSPTNSDPPVLTLSLFYQRQTLWHSNYNDRSNLERKHVWPWRDKSGLFTAKHSVKGPESVINAKWCHNQSSQVWAGILSSGCLGVVTE